MVTPFDGDLAVDHERLAELAAWLLDNGSDGLVVAGTTGESPTLTDAERLAMFRTVVEAVGDRAPVVAGTGSNDTAHSVELTRRAEACGVDAVLVVTPYYNKPPERGLIAHFRAVAAATSLPLIVYNIPGRCVVNLSPEALAELAAVENIVAVKQADPELEHTRRLRELCDVALYAGNDDMLLDVLEMGGAAASAWPVTWWGHSLRTWRGWCAPVNTRRRASSTSRCASSTASVHHRQSHPREDGAQPARAGGGRFAPAAGPGDRRGDRRRVGRAPPPGPASRERRARATSLPGSQVEWLTPSVSSRSAASARSART